MDQVEQHHLGELSRGLSQLGKSKQAAPTDPFCLSRLDELRTQNLKFAPVDAEAARRHLKESELALQPRLPSSDDVAQGSDGADSDEVTFDDEDFANEVERWEQKLESEYDKEVMRVKEEEEERIRFEQRRHEALSQQREFVDKLRKDINGVRSAVSISSRCPTSDNRVHSLWRRQFLRAMRGDMQQLEVESTQVTQFLQHLNENTKQMLQHANCLNGEPSVSS